MTEARFFIILKVLLEDLLLGPYSFNRQSQLPGRQNLDSSVADEAYSNPTHRLAVNFLHGDCSDMHIHGIIEYNQYRVNHQLLEFSYINL